MKSVLLTAVLLASTMSTNLQAGTDCYCERGKMIVTIEADGTVKISCGKNGSIKCTSGSTPE